MALALTVAGLDPSGGAGIAADLRVFARHGVHGTAVASVLTVQSTSGMTQAVEVSSALVTAQLEALLQDMPIAAMKTGALGSRETVRAVADCLADRSVSLVIDPVRTASIGGALLSHDAREVLLEQLMPHALLITPNAREAAWLSGVEVRGLADARMAARVLHEQGARAVLVKGGHLGEQDAVDLLLDTDGVLELRASRIAGADVHGLGCALSAAITARLACGEPLRDAVVRAKRYVRRAMLGARGLGRGRRLLDFDAALEEPAEP